MKTACMIYNNLYYARYVLYSVYIQLLQDQIKTKWRGLNKSHTHRSRKDNTLSLNCDYFVTNVLDTKKDRLIETVLWSIHNMYKCLVVK